MELVYVVKEKDLDKISKCCSQASPREWSWWDYFEPGTRYCKYTDSEKHRVFVWNLLDNGFFMERSRAEKDWDFKQIIPYCLVMKDDKVFTMERLDVNEKRLAGKISIGVGGHINPIDIGKSGAFEGLPSANIILNGMTREIQEEINIGKEFSYELVGFLYDNLNEVGRVHLGVVFVIHPKGGEEITVKETDQLKGQMVPKKELKGKINNLNLEGWSKIIIKESGLF